LANAFLRVVNIIQIHKYRESEFMSTIDGANTGLPHFWIDIDIE
jgi:hypothetical protein